MEERVRKQSKPCVDIDQAVTFGPRGFPRTFQSHSSVSKRDPYARSRSIREIHTRDPYARSVREIHTDPASVSSIIQSPL
jgi:hypothetical protein